MSIVSQITWRLRMGELVLWDLQQRRPLLVKRLTYLQVNLSELSLIDREAELCEREIARIRTELPIASPDMHRVSDSDSAILLERIGAALLHFDSMADRAAAYKVA